MASRLADDPVEEMGLDLLREPVAESVVA